MIVRRAPSPSSASAISCARSPCRPPRSRSDYTKRAAGRAEKAGKPYRRFRFHDIRHLFAVDYLRSGKGGIYDLQRILGHTSIKTTEVYLDYLTPEQAKAAMVGVAQKAAHKRRSGTAA
jgi:integrase/recombinase XerD